VKNDTIWSFLLNFLQQINDFLTTLTPGLC